MSASKKFKKTWKYNSVVTRVVDGDSFVFESFDLGTNIYRDKLVCRLYGADCPETRTRDLKEKAKGLESKRIVKELIEGKMVEIELLKKGKFGRWLCKIRFDGKDLTEFLIKNKLAVPYYGGKR